MIVLGLDTSAENCAAALIDRDGLIGAKVEAIGRGHAERLAPLARALFKETGVEAGRLDRIGVVAGPGNFTGLRIGVAFARGLSLTLGIPATGVSALACWAEAADPEGVRTVLAAHDSRRGDLAWQVFERAAPLGGMRLDPVEAVAERARALEAPMICGSGAALLGEALGLALEAAAPPDPEQVARLAAAQDNPAPPVPLYQRPPDAKLPGGITP